MRSWRSGIKPRGPAQWPEPHGAPELHRAFGAGAKAIQPMDRIIAVDDKSGSAEAEKPRRVKGTIE